MGTYVYLCSWLVCLVDWPISYRTCFNILPGALWMVTLKRISNWPLYTIWYYAIYWINTSKFWLLCIVHTNISINGKKTRFHVQNCPCGTVGTHLGYVRGGVAQWVARLTRNVEVVGLSAIKAPRCFRFITYNKTLVAN